MRSVNLRLHQALLEYGKSHIDVFETTSFQREDFMHLNSLITSKTSNKAWLPLSPFS
jgi:hypothetical protein